MAQIDLGELKLKIYTDNNIIPLLEALNCSHIHYEQNESLICAALPEGFDSHNKRTVQVKNNENLTAYIRSKGIEGNIFSVIGYILYDCECFEDVRENLYYITQWICNVLDYDIFGFNSRPKEVKFDWNYFLRKVQKDRQQELKLEDVPVNKPIKASVMNEYMPLLHEKWYTEGINHQTRVLFDIRYDLKSDRIVFPVHDRYGSMIGVKGRSIDDDCEYKYVYIYPCLKSMELFNLHRAMETIREYKRVYVFEAAKSTMLATQWGYKNCVSIEGDKLSPIQTRLLKELGIDIEICFIMDGDKKEEYVMKQIGQIKNRRVKIFVNKDRLLDPGKKQAPVDCGKETFEKIIQNNLYLVQ